VHWKAGLKAFFAVLGVVLALTGLHPLTANESKSCRAQIQHISSCDVVLMTVPQPLAIRAQDQLSMPHQVGVYLDVRAESPTNRLIETAARILPSTSSVLIVGTGASPELVMIARKFSHLKKIHGTDIDPQAIALSEKAIELNLSGDPRVKVWVSDGFASVTEKYDLVLFAAPRPIFLETLQRKHGDLSAIRMWSMMNRRKDLFDPEGKLRDQLLKDLDHVLTEKGRFLLMSDAIEEPVLGEGFDFLKHGLWLWGQERDGFFTVYDIFRDK
jgi:hypothetical protein